jgi:hypothetical protein
MTRPSSRTRGVSGSIRALATVALVVLGAAIAFPLGVIASHQFSDVPNTNTYHADIDALADSGVTTGCGNGTTFCPSAFVTREQMAAFMNRLGALGAGKVPVVNADKLDGIDSTGFVKGPVQAWREIGAAGQPGFTQYCLSLCYDIWSNYDTGHNSAAFYKDPLGVVRLKGLVKVGALPVLAIPISCDEMSIFVLPAGYRPAKTTIFTTLQNETFARVDILPSGAVVMCGPFEVWAGDYWLLDEIAFRAAQ